MKIYNTLTRQKEEFVPITPNEAKIYACGPTVYNFIHIGNARPICVFDVLRRYMEYRGMKVTFVQNFTDIDDKMIRRANEEGSDYLTVSRKYIAEYKKDAEGLNAVSYTHLDVYKRQARDGLNKLPRYVRPQRGLRRNDFHPAGRPEGACANCRPQVQKGRGERWQRKQR